MKLTLSRRSPTTASQGRPPPRGGKDSRRSPAQRWRNVRPPHHRCHNYLPPGVDPNQVIDSWNGTAAVTAPTRRQRPMTLYGHRDGRHGHP